MHWLGVHHTYMESEVRKTRLTFSLFKTRLVYTQNKPCLRLKEGFFAMQTSLLFL